jgi:hypothetical protein
MNKNDLALPSIHLNGTGKDDLVRQLSEAHLKLSQARDVLAQAAPHQRDYYVQKDQSNYHRARKQHEARLRKIEEVMSELLDLGIFIQDGGYKAQE